MAGENDGFNGSTMTFASVTFGGLLSLEYTESGAAVDVSSSEDRATSYRTGIPDPQLVATFVGGLPAAGCAIGTQGALTAGWEDGTDDGTLANAIVVDRGTSGSKDGAITSTVTFKPGQADAA